MLYECRSEFGVATAFEADSAREKIASGADSEPSAVLLIGAFLLFGESFNMLFYAFVSIFSAAFKKKTAFAKVFHYLITNLTTLQGGNVAIKPSAVAE